MGAPNSVTRSPIIDEDNAKLVEIHKITDEEFWACWASSEEFWKSLAAVVAAPADDVPQTQPEKLPSGTSVIDTNSR